MNRLSLISACIFALFLASCGGSGGGGASNKPADADSDGVPDLLDKCSPSAEKFISTPETDHDKDGCKDDGEDLDDDDDGVNDVDMNGAKLDGCPRGALFTSKTATDHDGDGCRDKDEDDDDDGDDIIDIDRDQDGIGDNVDVDDDNDSLIELTTAGELFNIRYDLNGTSKTTANDEGSTAGCPTTATPAVCKGYELSNDITLTDNWDPIAGTFGATLEGNNYTIHALKIPGLTTRVSTGFFSHLGFGSTVQNLSFMKSSVLVSMGNEDNHIYTGTLASINSGIISNVSVKQSSVSTSDSGFDVVGGLVGFNFSEGIVENSYADTVSVNGGGGDDFVGGLIGVNNGIIRNSYVTTGNVAVDGGSGRDLSGGLVGVNNDGTVLNSYATGRVVSGGGGHGENVGGLVGYNNLAGFVLNSYVDGVMADGGNSDSESVGGLVGYNEGFIRNSHAAGSSANGGAGNDEGIGGLVGGSTGFVLNSYATGSSANGGIGDDEGIGGLVGINESLARGTGTIRNSYATDSSANGGAGNDEGVGGLVGLIRFGGTIQNSYSLGDVNGDGGNDTVGRLLGKKETGTGTETITVTSNYYNSGSTLSGEYKPVFPGDEAVGKTSDELKALTDIDTGWSTSDWQFTDGKYPSLKSYDANVDGDRVLPSKLLCGQPDPDFVQCP